MQERDAHEPSGAAGDENAAYAGPETAFDLEDLEPRAFRPPSVRRMLTAIGVLVGVGLLVVVPPLVNVNRFRKQIASSLSASLGRPVYLDQVTLNLLPMPAFTLENFVVTEDPAFGAEPLMRANSVRARLRVSSLWRRRIEFSRITLDDPSVNLVRRTDGRWNLESILLQASKIAASPTDARRAPGTFRFPYIEATGARVNVKRGLEKLPLALTDATFALWLPAPEQWRLRLEGHPARTNAASTDAGVVRAEGTLGRAQALDAMPVTLSAEWAAAPLGGLSTVLTGADEGLRGEMDLHATVQGTVLKNAVTTRLEVHGARRAAFVPVKSLDVDVTCRAQAEGRFERLTGVRCAWPTGTDRLVSEGEMADTARPGSAEGTVTLKDVPAGVLLDAVRVASARVSPDLHLSGSIAGELTRDAQGEDGALGVEHAVLALGDGKPFLDGPVSATLADGTVTVAPMGMDLGGPTPAQAMARFDDKGLTVMLNGPVLRERVLTLAAAIPLFGDGLKEALPAGAVGPVKVDLTRSRSWLGGESAGWEPVSATKKAVGRRRRR